ncbi:MAG: hypothetical protein WC782_15080 [Methylococcaceae bacterium]
MQQNFAYALWSISLSAAFEQRQSVARQFVTGIALALEALQCHQLRFRRKQWLRAGHQILKRVIRRLSNSPLKKLTNPAQSHRHLGFL